jgi:hypothetical protein
LLKIGVFSTFFSALRQPQLGVFLEMDKKQQTNLTFQMSAAINILPDLILINKDKAISILRESWNILLVNYPAPRAQGV